MLGHSIPSTENDVSVSFRFWIEIFFDQLLMTFFYYRSTGIDIKSQAAYDLAVKGPLRPSRDYAAPVLYSMKCVDFTPPEFVLGN